MENWLERSELLVGREVIDSFASKRVVVVGVGGVGAFAAEMIARAGIGAMYVIDPDIVTSSNRNRQLLALESTIGMKKVDVISSRLRDINPEIDIKTVADFLNEDNVALLLGGEKIDYIVDAIDTLSPKIALIKYALKNGIPIVSSMGAGAKYDITAIEIADISKSYNCPLAYMLRKRLRKEGISSGFKVIFSRELPDKNAIVPVEEQNKKSVVGTLSYLPAAFGIACAQVVICYFIDISKKN